jgi:lauroyl/myristoyl acyltransferase
MHAAPPFVPTDTGDKVADMQRTVAQINERLEWLIRTAPEQYLWIHDRYRQPAEATVTAPGDDDDDDEQ